MKIIGQTKDGYLVEATAHELAASAGYKHPSEAPGWRRKDSYSVYDGFFGIGTTFEPVKTLSYLETLRKHEADVAASASVLEGLARMLRAALPTTMIPPEVKESPSEEPAK